jgi:hypothetical protein
MLDPAEVDSRLPCGVCRRQALADQIVRATLNVKRELIAQLTFRA